MSTTFDRNMLKEYIGTVENDTAKFVGSKFCAARLIGLVSSLREMGELEDATAAQLLNDAQNLMELVDIGHKYAKLARNPSPEMRIMVLADEQRERKLA